MRPLCATEDYNHLEFYSEEPSVVAECLRVCNICPVKRECGQQALDTLENWGIWGGMEDFRRRQAHGMDSTERPRARVRPMYCPNCRSKDLDLPSKKINNMYHVSCNHCGMNWKAHKLPDKSGRAVEKRESLGHRVD